MVLELKFNADVDAAIAQIKRRQYPARFRDYQGNLLLCGISYDKSAKTHSCTIEDFTLQASPAGFLHI